MYRSYLSTVTVLLLVSLLSRPLSAADPNEFLDYSVTGLPGRLYVPPEAMTSVDPRPFVLFLHGAGEIGNNNTAQVNGNINNLLDVSKERGAFLYAPQAAGSWGPTNRTSLVMDQVDQALASYHIDSDRVYVTGLSMGGGGTWNMLNRFSDRFAAGVPIAAISPSGDFNPSNLLGLPTWAFHARNDNVVPEQRSQEVINAILGAADESTLTFPPNGDTRTTFQYDNSDLNLHYTEWPNGGHGIWNRVYRDAELRDWMFSQSLIPEPSTLALGLLASVSMQFAGRRRDRKAV